MRFLGQITYLFLVPYFRIYGKRAKRPRTRAIIRSEGKILFVRNWLGLQRWSLPGGAADAGEELVDAIIREVKEEVGVEVLSAPVDIGTFWSHERLAPYRIELFMIDIEQMPDIAVDGVEIFDYRWIAEDEIDAYVPTRLSRLIADAFSVYRTHS